MVRLGRITTGIALSIDQVNNPHIGETIVSTKAIESSGNNNYETPPAIFEHWNRLFSFDMDVCASAENALVSNFFTEADSCLFKEWGNRNWMNPPYGKPEEPCKPQCKKKKCLPPTPESPKTRGHCITEYIPGLSDFVQKAYEQSLQGKLVVALIPSSRATEWWQSYVHKKADYIYDYPKRIDFLLDGIVQKGVAFDPCVVIWGLNP